MAEKEGLGLKEEIIEAILKRIDLDRIKRDIRLTETGISAMWQNIHNLEKRLDKFDDKREKQIIEMFKEIKEEIQKPKNEYQFFAQVLSFLIHSLTGKPTIQDLNIADPTIEQVKDWHDRLSLMVVEAGMNNDIWKDVLSRMKKYLGDE